MKITDVEAIELRLPEAEVEDKASAAQDALIIKIHTDAGITGIGEVDSSARVAKAVMEAPMGESEKLDLELVEGARLGVGDDNDVMVDAGCCWNTKTARTRARQFEQFRIFWLEELLQQDNLDGYRELSRVSSLPIAAGEGEAGLYAWWDLIDRGKIDIAQVDLARNGFTASRKIADMAEFHGLRVVNHFYSTPVNLAAGLHWLASRKSSFIVEYCVEETPIRMQLVKQDINAKDGFITVPEEPGLGVELNEDVVEKYRV